MAAIAADEEVSLCLRTVLKTGDCRVGGGGLEVPAESRQRPLDHPPMSSQPLVSTPRRAMRAFILRLRRACGSGKVVALVSVELLGPLAWAAPPQAPDRLDGVYEFLEDL